MNGLKDFSIIIPSLNPTDRLSKFVGELVDAGFDDIIIVDDGSGDAFSEYFGKLNRIEQCTVLTHDRNMGKGVALKTAFRFFTQSRSGKSCVLTADSDGQHLTRDIVKCANALVDETRSPGEYVVIGTRDFKKPAIPRRNAFGNRAAAFALHVLFGLGLPDTQTGLRGFHASLIPLLLEIPGSRFDYETNMLLEFKRLDISFLQVPIEAVYEEGANERSNYRPLRDSVMIFARIFKYAISSVTCFIVDISVFSLSMMLLGSRLGVWSVPCCTVIARTISSFLNFNINRMFVFRSKGDYGSRMLRYYSLVIMQMLLSAGGLWLITLPIHAVQPIGFITLLKILLDALLFFLSFYVQRSWVFK